MIANQAVFGGWNIASNDLGYPPRAGLLDKVLKNGFFHAPAENAARHDPGVNLPAPAGLAANDGGDHSVVAENILETGLYRKNIGVRLHRRDFSLAVTAGRQVELV